MYKRYLLIILLFSYIFFTLSFGENLRIYAEESVQNEISKEKSINKESSNDLEEEEAESTITTKIYKSTDPTLDFLEEQTKLQYVLESDILTKDELLSKSKKNKITKRRKSIHKETEAIDIKKNEYSFLLPWIVLFLLVSILGLIFKMLKKIKI